MTKSQNLLQLFISIFFQNNCIKTFNFFQVNLKINMLKNPRHFDVCSLVL